MSEVVLEGLTKRFGDFTAVDKVTLDILDEEFMVLLGPSGCGKTTALRMIAGLETITEGTLRIADRVVNDVEAKDRNISMVFQSYALYPHMTVYKNIESPLVARKILVPGEQEPRKLNKAERDERIHEAARTLGLDELMNRKPAALSGGQRQRVALARAIVSRPAAFLMDEPLSNLDAKLRAQTRLELVDLHKRLATTFIYVTHDQVEAMTMATRIAIINEGRLQQVGPPQAVYERPHNLFVARFIGSPPMNTVPGTFVVDAGEPFVDLDGAGRFPVAAVGGEPVVAGTKVIVGVRPEHLTLQPGEYGGVDARVMAVEWLGHERHVVCDVAGTLVTLREPSEGTAPDVGAQLRLGVTDPAEIHLFDPQTTERLN
ncbi:MAG: ATP-binding cassette domain-containing protein [Acidimicrobiales bacterium]|nr:ATP-binding cassette domain-containing protein [Acidimicrobiales bacterium]